MRRPLDPRVNPQNLTAGAREDLLGKRKFFAGGAVHPAGFRRPDRPDRTVSHPHPTSVSHPGSTPLTPVSTPHTRQGAVTFDSSQLQNIGGHPGQRLVTRNAGFEIRGSVCSQKKKAQPLLFSSEWRRCFTGSIRVGASAGLNDMYKRSLKSLSRRAVPPSVPRLDPGFRV